jgi:hypothetical protein
MLKSLRRVCETVRVITAVVRLNRSFMRGWELRVDLCMFLLWSLSVDLFFALIKVLALFTSLVIAS